jgi:hypothetical protein
VRRHCERRNRKRTKSLDEGRRRRRGESIDIIKMAKIRIEKRERRWHGGLARQNKAEKRRRGALCGNGYPEYKQKNWSTRRWAGLKTARKGFFGGAGGRGTTGGGKPKRYMYSGLRY